MVTYVNNIVEKLYELYGYSIIELREISGPCSNWGVYKKLGNVTEVIFFIDVDNLQQLDIKNIYSNLSGILGGENIRPIQVIIDSKAKIQNDENGDMHLNRRIYPQCEFVLINNVDNNVLTCSSNLENKAQELSNCMNSIARSTQETTDLKKFTITHVLIIINLLTYLLTSYLSGSILDSDINVLIFLGAKVNELINSGEYYRLLTCMFLHGGIIHVGFNMYALNSLGPLVENVYGKSKYMFIYFLSGIVSSVFSYIFSSDVSVGASGAIFGLLGAALVFAIKMKNRVGKDFMFNILSVIAVNLFIGFSMPNVDNFGHLGGLLGGVALSYFLLKGDSSQFS